MAKNKTQETVVSDTTAPQTNETLTANVQTAVIEPIKPVVKTPADILATALNAGIITQEQHDKLSPVIGEDFMQPVVSKMVADITKREQDVLGQQYQAIQSALKSGDIMGMVDVMADSGIIKVTITVDVATRELSVLRSNTKTGTSTSTGERTKTGKWLFTNGAVSHESLRQFVGAYDADSLTQSLNGTALCNKLKKHINANEWTVVNQDDKSVQPFAVWSAGKYNVQFS